VRTERSTNDFNWRSAGARTNQKNICSCVLCEVMLSRNVSGVYIVRDAKTVYVIHFVCLEIPITYARCMLLAVCIKSGLIRFCQTWLRIYVGHISYFITWYRTVRHIKYQYAVVA
jgi:hypothetical protein